MEDLDPCFFGINYDIGNSASYGYNHMEEISAYGDRILNVHVKDRKYMGSTVPLGSGDAQLQSALEELLLHGYKVDLFCRQLVAMTAMTVRFSLNTKI